MSENSYIILSRFRSFLFRRRRGPRWPGRVPVVLTLLILTLATWADSGTHWCELRYAIRGCEATLGYEHGLYFLKGDFPGEDEGWTAFQGDFAWMRPRFPWDASAAAKGGFDAGSSHDTRTGYATDYLVVPAWAVNFVCLLLLVKRCAAWIYDERLRRRIRHGQCISCGYDLRASFDRCPECGDLPYTPEAGPKSGKTVRLPHNILFRPVILPQRARTVMTMAFLIPCSVILGFWVASYRYAEELTYRSAHQEVGFTEFHGRTYFWLDDTPDPKRGASPGLSFNHPVDPVLRGSALYGTWMGFGVGAILPPDYFAAPCWAWLLAWTFVAGRPVVAFFRPGARPTTPGAASRATVVDRH